MTSLDELRSIQHQRIADEKAAFERERKAEADARTAAEQARAAAEAAKLREEREAQMRIEQARVDAEREARLRLEAAEAAERTRLQIQLDEQRRVDELALRRAQVAKQRPTWMLVVTGLAVCAGLALAWFAVERARAADESARATAQANRERTEALEAMKASREELSKIEGSLGTIETQLAAAQKAVIDAQTDAERKHAAQIAMDTARKERDIKKSLDDARRRNDDLIRKGGLHMDNCAGTATGCLPTPH